MHMKTVFISFTILLFSSQPVWMTDFDLAKQDAKQQQKKILLNFSGSDWCAPCIQLKKGVFEQSEFQSYAAQNLVLVQADFPRTKKKQLSPELKSRNEKLAETYNPQGKFPLTLLLDADGKILNSWEGYPGTSATDFVQHLKGTSYGK